MSDDPLFTLKQLADELGLPESTVRYYRDAFLDHIPSIGTGRRRRYPPAAIAVLRTIARHYAAGKSRAEIVAAVAGKNGHAAVPVEATARASRDIEDVSNVDLLAAILDGEREQRDALWQMAKEIVRLTEVLEGQDKVLGEIADRAGVHISAPRPAPLLNAPAEPAPAPIVEAAPPPPPPPPPPATVIFPVPEPVARPSAPRETAPLAAALFGGNPVMPPPLTEVAPAPKFDGARTLGHEEVQKLRAELEAERNLVERLRESKLQLEHRVADAEADLEHHRQRRPSVIQRLLRSDE